LSEQFNRCDRLVVRHRANLLIRDADKRFLHAAAPSRSTGRHRPLLLDFLSEERRTLCSIHRTCSVVRLSSAQLAELNP
jgi:hypothetical protein